MKFYDYVAICEAANELDAWLYVHLPMDPPGDPKALALLNELRRTLGPYREMKKRVEKGEL